MACTMTVEFKDSVKFRYTTDGIVQVNILGKCHLKCTRWTIPRDRVVLLGSSWWIEDNGWYWYSILHTCKVIKHLGTTEYKLGHNTSFHGCRTKETLWCTGLSRDTGGWLWLFEDMILTITDNLVYFFTPIWVSNPSRTLLDSYYSLSTTASILYKSRS